MSLMALFAFPQAGKGDHAELEDIFNRYGGPPLYRYYHLIPSHQEEYDKNRRLYPDANDYWGNRYYGNREPDPYEDYRLGQEILELERQQE